MDKLKMLKGMNEQERAQALESVIKSKARLFIAIATTSWFLLPTVLYTSKVRPGKKIEVNYEEVMQDATDADGFLEFINGEKIAKELVSMEGLVGPLFVKFKTFPLFFDKQRRSASLFTFNTNDAGPDDQKGFLSTVFLEITLDHLAVMPVEQVSPKTKADPINVLMMGYLDENKGKNDYVECVKYMLKNSYTYVDDKPDGTILWTSYSGKEQSATKKSMKDRFNRRRKDWKSSN